MTECQAPQVQLNVRSTFSPATNAGMNFACLAVRSRNACSADWINDTNTSLNLPSVVA